MRHIRVVSSLFGILAAASACATAGGAGSSPGGMSPRAAARAADAAARDSLAAQAIADREGPGARISAQIVSASSGSRHVRASFHLESDAYVVVGHVDADGILRIVFPADPTDDGFVRGDKAYQTNEFLAGFNDEYRMRASDRGLFRNVAARHDSYDGGLGYVFVIASWRPMRFDRFATDGRWDTYELANDEYTQDPRPAIREFASLLAGDAREAYTVQYASYLNTYAYASAYDIGGSSGYGYCSGFTPLGWASSPFTGMYNPYGAASFYGDDFSYRGSNYYYNAAAGCYTSGFRTYGFPAYGYGNFGYVSQVPVTTRPRIFDIEGHRRPPTPEPMPAHRFPKNGETGQSAAVGSNGETRTAHFSPEYRQRGLITSDEPTNGAPSRGPRIEARVPGAVAEHSRPSIQEMTGRSVNSGRDGFTGGHARATSNDQGSMGQGWTRQQAQSRQGQDGQQQSRSRFDPNSGSGSSGSGYQRGSSSDGGARAERGASSAPRSEPHYSAPAGGRSEAARSAPSGPPPAASAPASSSSSSAGSTGKPPVI